MPCNFQALDENIGTGHKVFLEIRSSGQSPPNPCLNQDFQDERQS